MRARVRAGGRLPESPGARAAAADVVGLAHTVVLRNHNLTRGMTDCTYPLEELSLLPRSVSAAGSAARTRNGTNPSTA